MGGVGNFQLHEGVCFAFELYCLIRFACGTREEHIAVAHVLEHYGAIVVGMYALFHVFLLFFIWVAGNNSVQWSFFLYVQMSVRRAFQLSQPDALCASLAGVRTEMRVQNYNIFFVNKFF